MNTHTDRFTAALGRCHSMIARYAYLLLFISPTAACTKGDKVPAYVDVGPMSMSTTWAQGGATCKVTDAWITVNERLVGVWELPARVPILAEGPNVIGVVPAIKRNGAFDDRLRYPFYKPWSATVDLMREGTSSVSPTTSYTDETLVWQEGFEDLFSQFTHTANSDVELQRFTPATHPDLIYLENGPCAGLLLDADHRFARIETDEDFLTYGGPAFMEIDHRSDIFITVGVKYFAGGLERYEPYVYLPPTRRADGGMPWNKVYLDLSAFFNSAVSERDVYIEAQLPASRSSAEIYLDNIKILRIP
ncbi:MAG TPA: hypothetical protein PKY96_01150 [Flavobacteriales bacterium]|nr:hypothetical protein [Flavobacteriales bacterium]